MKDVLILAGIGFAAYWILGQVMQSQQAAAVASCGALTATATPTSCPALSAVNARWAWYPVFSFTSGSGL